MKISHGFALPTVLVASVVLLAVLAAGISTTVAVTSSLRDQEYTKYAELAGEAGTLYAQSCLAENNNVVTWTNNKPLKPNTDCNGDVIGGASPYVMEDENTRTYFTVFEPVGMNITSKGYVEALRTSNGAAWRIWSSNVASAQSATSNLPVGTSLSGYWTSAPPGFLLEDGSAVSRSTYADLFAVIGTTFGSGNGSTTFNLPDSRGRVAVNKSSDTEFDTLGEKQGSKTHTLTTAQMPSHTHTGTTSSAGDHTHRMAYFVGDANDYISGSSNPFGIASDFNSRTGILPNTILESAGAHTHTFTTASSGSGSAHNNIQPSIVVLRVIKY